MLNGYGDIVPATHAGRILAIFVGVVVSISEITFNNVKDPHSKSLRRGREVGKGSIDSLATSIMDMQLYNLDPDIVMDIKLSIIVFE